MRLPLLSVLFCALAGLIALAPPGRAAPDPVYSVGDVGVDKSAASAVAAREAAQADARRRAARILLERLTFSQDRARLPQWSDRELNAVIGSVDVQAEQARGNRYTATLRVNFRPAAVRERLDAARIRYVESASRPYMLLPLAVTAEGGLRLWEETGHPWRQVWIEAPPATGLVPLLVARGEAGDLATVTADLANNANAVALRRLAESYGAAGAVIAKLQFGPQALTLTLRRVDPDIVTDSLTESFPRLAGESEQQTLARIVKRTADLVDDAWKGLNLPAGETTTRPAAARANPQDQFPEPVHGLGVQPSVSAAPMPEIAAGAPVPNPFPVPGSPPSAPPAYAGAHGVPAPPAYAGAHGVIVRAPLTGPASWVDLRTRLEALPLKTPLSVLALSRQEAMVAVDLPGGAERLRTLLGQQGWELTAGADGIHTAQKKGAN